MESFWPLLQRNVLNTGPWRTRAELHYVITHWIEHTYNRSRRQRGISRLTPIEFELAFTSDTTHAAALVTQPVLTRPTAIPISSLTLMLECSRYTILRSYGFSLTEVEIRVSSG